MSSSSDFNSLDVLAFYWRNIKYVTVVTIAAVIVSIIVALLIEPQYRSSVIIFPASNTSISKELLTDVSRSRKDILQFGEDDEVEQLLQILNSDEIKNRIVARYDLLEHYGIDESSAYPQTALAKLYAKNIHFGRTQYQSIEIEVFDKNPNLAAAIATDIVELLDTVYNKIQKKRALGALQIVEREYNTLQNRAAELQDSLGLLRVVGVFDYNTQTEAYTKALAQAIEKNNTRAQLELKKNLANLQRFGGLFLYLNSSMINVQSQLSLLSSKLVEARVDYEQNLSHKFVVNPAAVSEKKAKPIRWLIVVVSTISGFLFASVLLLFIERLKKLDIKHILEQN